MPGTSGLLKQWSLNKSFAVASRLYIQSQCDKIFIEANTWAAGPIT